jgi:uncharacterized membrane protein
MSGMTTQDGDADRPGADVRGGVTTVRDTRPDSLVAPSRDDPFIRRGSGLLGGPVGRRALVGRSWWTPLRVVLVFAVFVVMLGWWQKEPCLTHGWSHEYQYTRMCYSDVYALYFGEGIDKGAVPYRDHAVEYPVLTGGAMELAAVVARAVAPAAYEAQWFFTITALLLGICALIVVVTTARLAGRRPWDAALVALAPVLVFHAFTNWDLLAVAFASGAMLAWARRRPVLAGVLIGLGAAAKLYPALLLLVLLPLCLRARALRPWWRAVAGAAVTWVVVNAPVFILWRTSWWQFYKLNKQRPADWDSLWFQIGHYTANATSGVGHAIHSVVAPATGSGGTPTSLNDLTVACVLVLLAAVGWLAWRAPRRPRVPQVAFLVVIAFLLANKVWSPQYVLWYLPLAALALPRWRPLLVWQASEVVLLFFRYYYFVRNDVPGQGVQIGWYFAAVLARDVIVLVLAGLVVRDILRPEHDPVRRYGDDDPAGGVLDGSPHDVSRVARNAAGTPSGAMLASG